MCSDDGNYVLVYNGEIYNYVELRTELRTLGHSFHSDSDSEVLLVAWQEWGEACLERLTGMFAFGLWDERAGLFHLVRDAFGVKPLYYTRVGGRLAFASEIQALRAISGGPLTVDSRQAFRYLQYGFYDDEDSTFFEEVHRVPPGHHLRIDLRAPGAGSPERWWNPSIEADASMTFAQATEEFRERFLGSVRMHMRSDVRIGAALSGGLDSSALVGAMRFLEPDLELSTFSYISDDAVTSERQWVELMNGHVQAVPHLVHIDRGTFFADLDDLIATQGEPFGSTSVYAQYRVFKRVAQAGITVTLDGQGADELLAGYAGYPVPRLQSLLSEGRLREARRFMRGWSSWPDRSQGLVARGMLLKLAPDSLGKARRRVGGNDRPWIQGDERDYASLTPPSSPRPPRGRFLASALRDALTGQGLQALLRHGDRNSMAFSLESRVPFLTTSLAEFLLRLPEEYLVSPDGETKRLLRASLRGIVPNEVLDRRTKIGFVAPQGEWLRAERNFVSESLSVSGLDVHVDIDNAKRLVSGFLNGEAPASQASVWRVVNFARWLAKVS
jgi:asparagine synthase (glutamine-hydrolysing)